MDSAAAPGPRHLYLIVLGVILGIFLGPAVLGRLAPATYIRCFLGGQEIQQQLDQAQRDIDQARLNLLATGVTSVAADEFFQQQQQPKLIALRAQVEQAQANRIAHLDGILHALVIALLGVMVLETLVEPAADAIRARIAAARYVLMALWLALALAQPALLRGITPLATVGLIVVALAVILIPWGNHGQPSNPTPVP